MAGTIVGGYRILRELGAGAFGKVYAVEELESGTLLAMKIFSHTSQGKSDFEHEVNAYNILGVYPSCRKHVVCMYAYGIIPETGDLYIATELMSGDLTRFTGWEDDEGNVRSANYRLSDPLAILLFMRQALEGLRTIHESGMSHSDIKPPNILYTIPEDVFPSGAYFNDPENIKDKVIFKFGDPGLTCTGSLEKRSVPELMKVQVCTPAGTTLYMAPQYFQLHIQKFYPPLPESQLLQFYQANDIWGLGQVFHAVIDGHGSIQTPDTIYSQADIIPVNFSSGQPVFDSAINKIINGMLVYDYGARPSATELYLYLNNFLLDYLTPEPFEVEMKEPEEEEKEVFFFEDPNTGERMVADYDPNLTIERLKNTFAEELGIPVDMQIYAVPGIGRIYTGTLEENYVSPNDTIIFMLR